MLRKLLIVCLGIAAMAAISNAAPRKMQYDYETIGPTTSALASVVISSPSAGISYSNCLTNVRAGSLVSGQLMLNIVAAGATVYTVIVPTGTVADVSWPQNDPICAPINRALQITVVDSGGAAATQVKMNYQGYIRKE